MRQHKERWVRSLTGELKDSQSRDLERSRFNILTTTKLLYPVKVGTEVSFQCREWFNITYDSKYQKKKRHECIFLKSLLVPSLGKLINELYSWSLLQYRSVTGSSRLESEGTSICRLSSDFHSFVWCRT